MSTELENKREIGTQMDMHENRSNKKPSSKSKLSQMKSQNKSPIKDVHNGRNGPPDQHNIVIKLKGDLSMASPEKDKDLTIKMRDINNRSNLETNASRLT